MRIVRLGTQTLADHVRACEAATEPVFTPPDPSDLHRTSEIHRLTPAPVDTGGALASALLANRLGRAERLLADLSARPDPVDLTQLCRFYADLGDAMATATAVLEEACNALSPRVGTGRARPALAYRHLERRARIAMQTAGEQHGRMSPFWSRLVFGGGSWSARPVKVNAAQGSGAPPTLYANTFKTSAELSLAEQRRLYAEEVRELVAAGGRFEDILVAENGFADALPAGTVFDFTMAADGTTRLWDQGRPADAGHAILAVGGPTYDPTPVLMAGELSVIRDSAGDLIAVVVSTGSGHFLPAFADAANVLAPLARLGVDPSQVVLVGGPSDLPSMAEELVEKHGCSELADHLPVRPEELLERWKSESALGAVRPRQLEWVELAAH